MHKKGFDPVESGFWIEGALWTRPCGISQFDT